MTMKKYFKGITSPVYFLNRLMNQQTIRYINLNLKYQSQWLDVGCGLRPFEDYFHGATYIGIDVWESGAALKMKEPDLYFNGEELPFANETFDGILCTHVFEHVANLDKLINECKRVLKPTGVIIFSVPFIYREHEMPFDFRRFTIEGLRKIFVDLDFKVESLTKIMNPLETIITLFLVWFANTFRFRSNKLNNFIIVSNNIIFLVLNRFLPRQAGNHDLYIAIVGMAKK
jgi:SAM-dependent methyltransferase